MALVKFKSRKVMFLPPETANAMWLAMYGYIKPTPEQERFLRNVEEIYLNRHRAPEQYLRHMKKKLNKNQKSLFDSSVV